MSEDADFPEPDRAEGAPHPRHVARIFGQDAAEAVVLAAHRAGRLHHAWLLTGPAGIGKASFAWRMARFLLTHAPEAEAGLFGEPPAPPETLDPVPAHPVLRRMAALAEPRLCLIRRGYDHKEKRLKTQITVDEVRRLKGFFQLSAADGGRRVAIIDAADEMNPSAANALLKILEEPPADAHLLIVCHRPAGLLPTIRSRCRELRLAPLSAEDIALALAAAGVEPAKPAEAAALAALSGGSAGAALRLATLDGIGTYRAIAGLAASLPGIDRPAMLALADAAGARGGEDRFALIVELLEIFLSRLTRSGISGPPATEIASGETATLSRLCPDAAAARRWAALAADLGARARQGRAVNLDPAALILDMVLRLDETARALGRLAS